MRHASGAEPRPIVWIGQRHVACATHPNPRQVWPIRIAAHAFAPDQPARDLFLSSDHALFIDDVLIPVKHLINDHTMTQIPTEAVTYYHVELASHDVILAEGLPVESYLDTGDRTSFANAAMVITLFPTFGPQGDHNLVWEARAVAPLVVTGPIVRAVRLRLARAGPAWSPHRRRTAGYPAANVRIAALRSNKRSNARTARPRSDVRPGSRDSSTAAYFALSKVPLLSFVCPQGYRHTAPGARR